MRSTLPLCFLKDLPSASRSQARPWFLGRRLASTSLPSSSMSHSCLSSSNCNEADLMSDKPRQGNTRTDHPLAASDGGDSAVLHACRKGRVNCQHVSAVLLEEPLDDSILLGRISLALRARGLALAAGLSILLAPLPVARGLIIVAVRDSLLDGLAAELRFRAGFRCFGLGLGLRLGLTGR